MHSAWLQQLENKTAIGTILAICTHYIYSATGVIDLRFRIMMIELDLKALCKELYFKKGINKSIFVIKSPSTMSGT